MSIVEIIRKTGTAHLVRGETIETWSGLPSRVSCTLNASSWVCDTLLDAVFIRACHICCSSPSLPGIGDLLRIKRVEMQNQNLKMYIFKITALSKFGGGKPKYI